MSSAKNKWLETSLVVDHNFWSITYGKHPLYPPIVTYKWTMEVLWILNFILIIFLEWWIKIKKRFLWQLRPMEMFKYLICWRTWQVILIQLVVITVWLYNHSVIYYESYRLSHEPNYIGHIMWAILYVLKILQELLQLRAQEMGKMRKGNLLNDLLSQRDKNGRTVLFHCLDCNSISGKNPFHPWSRQP